MDENSLLKTIIYRIKEQYIKDALKQNKANPTDFNEGVLLGLGNAMTVIQNDIISYFGKEALRDFGIDFNCDDFSDLFQENQPKEVKFKKSTSLFDGKGEKE